MQNYKIPQLKNISYFLINNLNIIFLNLFCKLRIIFYDILNDILFKKNNAIIGINSRLVKEFSLYLI